MKTNKRTYQIYLAFDQEDAISCGQLMKHLALLRQSHDLEFWHKDLLNPGSNKDQTIYDKALSSDIVLLVLSSDFLASSYYEALKQQLKELDKKVVPIVLRACHWEGDSYLQQFNVLPENRQVVLDADKGKTDASFKEIVRSLDTLINKIKGITPQEIKAGGDVFDQHYITLPHPFEKNHFIIGRDKVLAEIEQILAKTNQPLVIHGASGSGKTVLVEKYLSKHKKRFKNIAWLNYEGNLLISILNQIVTKETIQLDEDSAKPNHLFRAARMIIRDYILNVPGNKLLVFDGIAQVSELEEYRAFFEIPNSQIIITAHQPIEGFTNFALPMLSDADATRLFETLATHIEEPAIKELIPGIQNSPLGIKLLAFNTPKFDWQAAKSFHEAVLAELKELDAKDLSLQNFLQALFDHSELRLPEEWLLLQFAALPYAGYSIGEIGHLVMASELGDEGKMEFLPDFAHSAGYQNYAKEFAEDAPENPGKLEAALEALTQKGWIEQKEAAYFLPELVREVVIEGIEPWSDCYVELIETLRNNYYGDEYGPVKGNALYISHLERIISVLEYGESYRLLHKQLIKVYEDLLEFSNQLREQEKYTQVVEENEVEENEIVWEAYKSLAESYLRNGKLPQAFVFGKKQIKLALKIYLVNHPNLAEAYYNISLVHKELGQYDKALEFAEIAIEIMKINLDANHPNLAAAYHNISSIYIALGQYDKALEFAEKNIEISEMILDTNHPNLAATYNNTALVYIGLEQYDKALEFAKKTIGIWEVALDANHPDLATACNNISLVYSYLEQYDKALEFAKKTIEISEMILDTNHPNLAIAYNNIASIYRCLEQYDKALELAKKTIEIWEAALDANHPNLAKAYNNISTVYSNLGQYGTALEFAKKTIEIWEIALDANHPDLAKAYNNISTVYSDLGQYDLALKFAEKAIKIAETVDTLHSFDLTFCYNTIAEIYTTLKQPEKAAIYSAKAKAINDQDQS